VTDRIDQETLMVARAAVDAAEDKQGHDTIVLDVGDVLAITQLFVVTSASNPRQLRTIAGEVSEQVRTRCSRSPKHTEGAADDQWILLDYGDVVVHVFAEEARRFYEIERLYRDVPVVELS
jgi:ribosome-associated protein